MTTTDLPEGYRWADEEDLADLPDGWIDVPRTVDSNGVPYTQGESDIAVPALVHTCAKCGVMFDEDIDGGVVLRFTSEETGEVTVLKTLCFTCGIALLEK